MFRFEHSQYLWVLCLVPVMLIALIMLSAWKKKALKSLGDSNLFYSIIPDYSSGKTITKNILLILAYIFLVLGIANPQIGSKLQEVKRKGVDVMVALDLSNSMLAEDIKPNRITAAKLALSKFIDELKNDRIGLVVFGGQAYTQLPITTDFAAAKLFLSTITTKMIPTQGTAIGLAIEQSMSAFDFENSTSKVIVVITDGENHEDDAIDVAKAAQEKGVIIHTIGLGSIQGSPIPLYKNGRQTGFMKDNQGNSVVTKLNIDMLKEIAGAGSGLFVQAHSGNVGLNYILDEIDSMEKSEFGTKVYTDYEDRFQYFIGISMLLLVFEVLLHDKKNKWLNNKTLFGTK